jgi:apolipoprotein N-acyltransferase
VVARAPQRRQVVLERSVALLHGETPAMWLGAWPERLLSGLAVATVLAALVLGHRRGGRLGGRLGARRRRRVSRP